MSRGLCAGAPPGAAQGPQGVAGAPPGRLIASACSNLDLLHLRSVNQGGKLKLAQGLLQDPDVQWSLVVVRDFGGNKASVRLSNITGRGKDMVCFTGRIDTESTFGAAHPGTVRTIGPDGLVDELTNFLDHGSQSKMQVHVSVHYSGSCSDTQQGDDLSSDLNKLLDQGVLSDVLLQVKTKTGEHDIRAHKAVLAARSPVFQRLFLADMAESRTSTVAVQFPAPVMERVLRYVYTGREDAEDGELETDMEVLAAADYYQLAGLKRLCEERLLSSMLQRVALAPEEVLLTAVLADRYGAPALKERALELAASNIKQLRAHPDWKEFASQHPDLVAELMGVMADKLEQAQQHANQLSSWLPNSMPPPFASVSPADSEYIDGWRRTAALLAEAADRHRPLPAPH